MNYQDIVNTIRNTATAINLTGSFVHGRRSDGSLEYDKPFPQIHLMPLRSTFDIQNDIVKHDIVIMFWGQDSPESSNDKRELIIAQMDLLSSNFINSLNSLSNISLSNVLKTPEYRQLAGTVSGYGLSFTLTSKTYC